LSLYPDGVARCCQKEYSLTRDTGSSGSIVSTFNPLGQEIKKRKKLQAASFKQQAA